MPVLFVQNVAVAWNVLQDEHVQDEQRADPSVVALAVVPRVTGAFQGMYAPEDRDELAFLDQAWAPAQEEEGEEAVVEFFLGVLLSLEEVVAGRSLAGRSLAGRSLGAASVVLVLVEIFLHPVPYPAFLSHKSLFLVAEAVVACSFHVQ